MRFVNENRKIIADNMTYIYFHIEYQSTKDKNALYYNYRKMNRVAITSSSLSIIPNKFLNMLNVVIPPLHHFINILVCYRN